MTVESAKLVDYSERLDDQGQTGFHILITGTKTKRQEVIASAIGYLRTEQAATPPVVEEGRREAGISVALMADLEIIAEHSGEDAGSLCEISKQDACAILALTPVAAQGDEVREALEPFATFYPTFANEDGWTSPMTKERIVDWFGPADFRRAAKVFATLGAPHEG